MRIITEYKNIKSPQVLGTLTIDECLRRIREGDEYLTQIELARAYGKGNSEYVRIKTWELPTFRFNFTFDSYAVNKNIIAPTGLIYIDVDNCDKITESDYIFALWKSLSSTGYGILAKVDNLTPENFRYVYEEISEKIGIDSDVGARRATQQTVLSYDENLYFNPDSTTYSYKADKKVSHTTNSIKEKEKKCLGVNETYFTYNTSKIRFNNIDDYFIDNDKTYIYFKDKKELICKPYIPSIVKKGRRNITLFYYLSQIVALNYYIHKNYLKAISDSINIHNMKPKLSDNKIDGVIKSVLKKKREGSLKMFLNKERRFLFNPDKKLNHKEKMKIIGRESSLTTKKKNREMIKVIIEDWDFQVEGKITQVKVAKIWGRSSSTVKRYWHNFKEHIGDLNHKYKLEKREHLKVIKRSKYSSKSSKIDDDKLIYSINKPLDKSA